MSFVPLSSTLFVLFKCAILACFTSWLNLPLSLVNVLCVLPEVRFLSPLSLSSPVPDESSSFSSFMRLLFCFMMFWLPMDMTWSAEMELGRRLDPLFEAFSLFKRLSLLFVDCLCLGLF